MEIFKHIYGFDYDTVVLSINGKKAFCQDCNGLVILDITDTHNTVEIGRYGIDGFAMHMVVSADETKAYITVRNVGLLIVDISDTLNPVEIGSCEILYNNFDMALSKDETKAYVVNNTYPTSGRKSHLIKIDVSDPSNPRELARLYIAGRDGCCIILSKDGKKAFVSCGEFLEVVDIEEEEN